MSESYGDNVTVTRRWRDIVTLACGFRMTLRVAMATEWLNRNGNQLKGTEAIIEFQAMKEITGA